MKVIERLRLPSCDSIDDEIDKLFSDGFAYRCTHDGCGLQFRRKDQLDSHVFTHTLVKAFVCSVAECGKSYVNNAHLQRHIRNVHKTLEAPAEIACKSTECQQKFKTNFEMQSHFRREHKTEAFCCDICNEKFHRKFLLRIHLASHTGDFPYECTKCDRGFLRMSYLRRHEKCHKLYNCEHCDDTFNKWSLLVAHKRNAHANPMESQCKTCGRVFRSKHGQKYHQQIHQPDENRTVFQCDIDQCPKYFFHRKNLLAHVKSKHENRTYHCTIDGCGRQLSSKQKLNQHIEAIHVKSKAVNEGTAKMKRSRVTRKDKGVPKKSTAAKLLNLIAPSEIEAAIIAGEGERIEFIDDRSESETEKEQKSF